MVPGPGRQHLRDRGRRLSAVEGLPHIDVHEVRIAAPPQVVYPALRQYVESFLEKIEGRRITRLLGTDPPAGFAVAELVPDRLVRLTGRHRFSRYQLVFELADAPGGSVLRARSYAEFPGLGGRLYRAAVVGTRSHVLATRHLLRSIRRRVPQDGDTGS